MKILKNTLTILLTATLVFASCESNDDNDIIITTRPTAEEFDFLFENVLEDKTQTFQFDAEDGYVTFTSENGVDISINGNCLTLNGNAVTGEVDIDYVEVFDKASMLTTNKPTMGIMENGDKALLISGGEFYVEASQNGEALETNCPINLAIPADLTGGTDNDMTLWTGVINEEGELAWEEEKAAGPQGERGVFVEGSQYYAFLNDFGWSNVDRFYSDPRPKTSLLVDVPEGYDHTNCSIFLSYDGEETGLASLDTYLPEDDLFSEHYGQIPIGLECHLIFVTEDGGDWKYAIKAVTIEEDGIITFTDGEMSTGTEAQLVALIDALP